MRRPYFTHVLLIVALTNKYVLFLVSASKHLRHFLGKKTSKRLYTTRKLKWTFVEVKVLLGRSQWSFMESFIALNMLMWRRERM
jgi:hypothetical protein